MPAFVLIMQCIPIFVLGFTIAPAIITVPRCIWHSPPIVAVGWIAVPKLILYFSAIAFRVSLWPIPIMKVASG